MNITITPDIEEALAQKASQDGVSPEKLALDTLRKKFVPKQEADMPAGKGKTLYDVLKDHIGVIYSSEFVPGGAQMSVDCGKKFAEGMWKNVNRANNPKNSDESLITVFRII